jgi:hypothetical protein
MNTLTFQQISSVPGVQGSPVNIETSIKMYKTLDNNNKDGSMWYKPGYWRERYSQNYFNNQRGMNASFITGYKR